jgi:hypothetical protein
MAPFKEYGLGAYGFVPAFGLPGVGELAAVPNPFVIPAGLAAGLVEFGCVSEGSEEFVLFSIPRGNPKALVDLDFVRTFGGDGGLGLGAVARGAAEELDC